MIVKQTHPSMGFKIIYYSWWLVLVHTKTHHLPNHGNFYVGGTLLVHGCVFKSPPFLVGGYSIGYSKKTWYFHEKWIEGPDLGKGRRSHSLGIVRYSLQEYVVAVGGYGGSYLNDVEIMSVEATAWVAGKLSIVS